MAISAPRKVLVIQTAFLGDVVLATSFLANLRSLLPDAQIWLLTTPVGAKMLTPNPFGVQLIAYDKRGKEKGVGGFLRLSRRLRELAPDLTFCLHRSIRSSLLAKVAGGEAFGFRDAAGSVLFEHRVARRKGAFEAEKNHQLLQAWAGALAKGLPLFPRLKASPEDARGAEELLPGLDRFVALAPSSVWATKRWPAERFAELAARLEQIGWRSVLVGGGEPEDLEAAEVLLRAYAGSQKPLNLVGRTSLGVLKSVLSRASLVVANDSAPLHVAIAMGAPVIGVFGPTTRELGFFPLAQAGKAAVVEVPGLSCRPCGLHGHHKCPRGHFRCMLEIEPKKVFQEAEKILCP